ncbi:MAG: Ni/Fe hydrogenase subunit alpha [archaeon]
MAREITLDHIAKIEGHATLKVKIEKNEIKEVNLNVTEGSRYFEKILKGRKYDEAPYLTTRICGICSCIHNVGSLKAVENAFGVQVTEQTALMRERVISGERIRSHAAHLYMFVLPEYLGFESAVDLASEKKETVLKALELVKLGNNIIETFAGRSMHPISTILGGFSHYPERKQLDDLLDRLKASRKFAEDTAKLFKGIKVPKFERETQYFCLDDKKTYPTAHGEISCIGKMCVPTMTFATHAKQYFVPYSTAKHVTVEGESYYVGSLARINNCRQYLRPRARKMLNGIKFPNYNPYMNNFCQAVETVHHVENMIDFLENYEIKEEKLVKVVPKASRGISAVEAPRGLLFHDYTFDANGIITHADIITPTSQNLKNIEDDLKVLLPQILSKGKEEVVRDIKKLIRAYDPCISCSTHFLTIEGLDGAF